MGSSRLFWRFFSGFACLVILSALVFGVLIADGQQRRVRQQLLERLRVSTILLGEAVAHSLDSGQRTSLQQKVKQLGESTQIRLTVIALDGRVLADSAKDTVSEVDELDNHSGRPELIEAAKQGWGASERHSTTEKKAFAYAALRIDRDDMPVALARAALPIESFQQYYDQIRRQIWLFAGLVSLIALVGGYAFVARIINPLVALTRAVERIAEGDHQEPIEITDRNEIGLLATSFNRINSKLSVRIAELRERGDQLAAVLGGMDEGVIAVDDDAHILFANKSAGRLFDFDSAQANGRPLLSTIRDETLRSSVRKAISTRSSVFSEIELLGPNAGTLAVHANPLPGEPCPGVVLVLDDRTELQRLESLRQEFVANVSHELKTPLSSIKAYAETLRDGAIYDDEHNVVFVQRIVDQADRLHQLILDLLSLARIESGQISYETHDVIVQPIVDACLEHHQAAANAKSIRLSAHPPASPVVLRTDEEALRQILDNLVNNAIKYTPADGEVLIRWTAETRMGLIEVSDTGIGIAKDDQERLFERFFRVDKARSRELGGTGLGLSIVKHLAHFFGGSLGVESTLGQGSTFWVRLPLT